MDQSIISVDTIRAKARFAFRHGRSRNDHGFNWHAPAIEAWQAEWDRCAAQAQDHITDVSKMVDQLAEVSPP